MCAMCVCVLIGYNFLVFLSSGGHGTTQLPSEKLLSYSGETFKREFSELRSSYHL